MKQEMNPIVVIAIVVVVVGAVGWFLYSKTGGTSEGDAKSMPMPKEAAEGMAKMRQQMQGGGGPGGPGGSGGPGGPPPAPAPGR